METSKNRKTLLRSFVLRYGLALLSVTLAHLITQALYPTLFPTPLFFAAIVISTWFGGTGPGLFAVVFGTLLLDYFFLSPVHAFSLRVADIPYLAQFVLPALLSGWFTKKRKEAEAALREARDYLEIKVQERTSELLHTNEQLQSEMAERKRAEEDVRKTQSDLVHLTRIMTMSELTTSIAHEVNQPLAAIVTNGSAGLRWLAAEPPNLDRARESVTSIIQEGNRASEVIRQIRALSKKALPQKSALAINEVIKDVLALVRTELVNNRIVLTCELKRGLPSVLGDRVQLQQVILNLIMNGIEAMEETTQAPRELLVQSGTAERDQVLVSVRDTGVGLNPEQIDQIFEAFFTTKDQGIGMGLSISRTIIESHGGRIWASAANNEAGAAFQFTLPAAEGAS
jgi:C4-dicarboxylate-specific signal transduction histidine kinase